MQSRTRTVLGIALAVLGLLSLAAAGILRWVVLPDRARLPADTNTTRTFEGTAALLLNAQALSSGNTGQAVLRNVPVRAERNVRTLATDGNVAEVRDTRVLTTGGTVVGRTEATYAVDRKTLEAAKNHPAGWNVVDHQGLTVSWPLGAEKKTYTGWVADTQSTTPVRYVRQETKQGVSTYVYAANSEAQPVRDPQVLATLPQSLPVSALAALSGALSIPSDLQAQLAAVLPRLTEPIPLSYTYQVTATYWVEPTTGLVLDTQREEIRRAGLALPGGQSIAAIIPVYDVSTAATQASLKDAAKQAQDDKNAIETFGTTLPLILLIAGVILLGVGILLIILGRRSGGAARRRPAHVAPPPSTVRAQP